MTRNHCLEILRKKGRHLTVSYDSEFMQSQEVVHPFIEADTSNDKMQALTGCLETLKGEQKACVQLFYFEGQSYKDIASLKNIELNKVRSFIQNGRRNLKNCIEGKAVGSRQ